MLPLGMWRQYRRNCMPIPLIKDLISFRELAMYGGYWADLDVFWIGNGVPASTLVRRELHEVVLFTEYQRAEGQSMQPAENCYWQARDTRDDGTTRPLATVNLGFAHSVAGAAFWTLCYDYYVGYWENAGASELIGISIGMRTSSLCKN